MLYRAMLYVRPTGFGSGFFRRIKDAPASPGIYKTHDFPPSTVEPNDRFIFLFREPLPIVSSVLRTGELFKRQHFSNLGAIFIGNEQSLIDHDGLNLEYLFMRWKYWNAKVPVIIIQYEAIWNALPLIQEFSGLEFSLPTQKTKHLVVPFLNVDFTQLESEMDADVFLKNYVPGDHQLSSDFSVKVL